MSNRGAGGRSARRILAIGAMAVGALLLVMVPLMLVVLAFSSAQHFDLPGMLVILSAAAGMALVVVGAALYD